VRIAFLGTGEFAVPALRALCAAGHELAVVISQPDRPAGRGREVRPTPVRAAAESAGLPHVPAEDVNALDARVLRGAELGVVAAFGQKIGPALLGALPRGAVNVHGSLLPKYRGAAPYQRAIMGGEEQTGVTVFQLDERWDAGAVWARRATPIGETETADELHDRLASLGAELVLAALVQIAGGGRPQPQDPRAATRAPKLKKDEGTVDWSQPARLVARRINGLWSWPAAACLFASRSGKQERVLLARAVAAEPGDARPAGAVVPGAFLADGTVQAGTGRVRLLELRPASGKLMSFEAFANGRRIAPPDRLLPVRE
jgi:methionyl-tRNA formyltransferase